MDILFVNAPVNTVTDHSRFCPPLGLAYLCSVLIEHEYDLSAVDLNVTGFERILLAGIIERENPKLIGISTTTETYLNGLEIARIAKQINPNTKIIMGGVHASVMHREAAKDKCIDIVVRGEGEVTLLELADYLIRKNGALSDIYGITYEENGDLVVTPDRPLLKNPDNLPLPSLGLFPLQLYHYPGRILSSRGGCQFNCRFCAVNSIWKGRRRSRSPESLVQEIIHINRELQLEEISFADDTFTADRNMVLDLCRQSQRIRPIFPWHWTCSTRVNLVDDALLHNMRSAGCYHIQYGIEAGSQQIFDSIGKGITLKQIRLAVKASLEAGMGVLCSFMFPQPEDTEETIREQGSLMAELQNMGAEISVAFTTPYPGTYYYNHAKELGIQILAKNWSEYDAKHLIITTRHLNEDKLNELFEEHIRRVMINRQSV